MRTPFLQYLYLQKPVTMVVVACAVAVLPWIGLNDFSTKGEPREAAVAVSMFELGNWVLPSTYADEFAYKPPMAHWLMAVFSLPQGHVSEGSARLPSALAYIILMGVTLFFFGHRIKFQEAFITVLLLLTCIEIHRAGITARVDMLLTAFMVLGLFALYRWENRLDLKGLPVVIPLLLGCAVLTKGPVGVILPLFAFGVHLFLLRKYRLRIIGKALFYIGVSSLFLPLIWYVAAWKQGGDDFLNVVLAENFGRFFHIGNSALHYDLGHEHGVWYNFATLLAGFIPWTILFFFSLFGMKPHRPSVPFREIPGVLWWRFRSMEKLKRFSLVVLCCVFFFYSIPAGKRSVYLMPAYPFIALFLAQYTLYLTEYRTKVIRFFAGFLAGIAAFALAVAGLVIAGVIDPVAFAGEGGSSLQFIAEAVGGMLTSPDYITFCVLLVVLAALITVFYQMNRKINLKMLYAALFLTFAINLMIDGVIMRGIHKERSSRPFAEHIMQDYPLDENNVYVMNNLKEYGNLYGLNFYMKNRFHNFEKEQPEAGYFLTGDKQMEKVIRAYGDKYAFHILTSTDKEFNEIRQKIILAGFSRKK
jgi:4-amino-4-deoxy-L-arabinose transferase-like glycosyltransferase